MVSPKTRRILSPFNFKELEPKQKMPLSWKYLIMTAVVLLALVPFLSQEQRSSEAKIRRRVKWELYNDETQGLVNFNRASERDQHTGDQDSSIKISGKTKVDSQAKDSAVKPDDEVALQVTDGDGVDDEHITTEEKSGPTPSVVVESHFKSEGEGLPADTSEGAEVAVNEDRTTPNSDGAVAEVAKQPILSADDTETSNQVKDEDHSTPGSDDMVVEGDSEGATSSTTLREKLLAKSLETKKLISEQLEGIFATPPDPQYQHYQHSDQKVSAKADQSCDQEDAFSDIPIDGTAGKPWSPPKGASTESLDKWESEYKSAMQRIKEVKVGGSELRDFAKEEVQRLRDLRHQLFCKDGDTAVTTQSKTDNQ